MNERIAVVGLGYVGLPVAVAFGRKFSGVVGYDIDTQRVDELRCGHDRTDEVEPDALADADVHYTTDPEAMKGATFIVVTVPTPIDSYLKPDLTAVRKATEVVGRVLEQGAVVVYESTVYPGVTEEVCGAILEQVSGLKCGVDFHLGYSPERINPGDREHTFERIVKVVAGDDEATLERVAAAYCAVVDAGVFRARSIKVAEAAKVIENTQRDLNIALMNELAVIFDRVGIRTRDVLDAAGTKWNFLKFTPGLVGGHCIGVDPYYLTTMAESTGYYPEVILAGRRINESMGLFVAQRLVKMLIQRDRTIKGTRVAVLGITFKPDIHDLRNTKVVDLVRELSDFGLQVHIHDPMADPEEVQHEYGLQLSQWDELGDVDALILAVPHRQYLAQDLDALLKPLHRGGVFLDLKSVYDPANVIPTYQYWSL